MEDLKLRLKEQIIEQINLEELSPSDIENDQPLFGDDGIGLDSIDALEFIVLLEQNYNIKVTDPKQGKDIFYSIDSLAKFIESKKA
jgi:acyl carrier protein